MNSTRDSIQKMLSSSDKESIYLGVSLLRKNDVDYNRLERHTLLNKVALENRIKSYGDICEELNEKELTIEDFCFLPISDQCKSLAIAKLKQIERVVNNGWIPDWDNQSQQKWYPWFNKAGSGLVFRASGGDLGDFAGAVAYFYDEKTSNWVGNIFIDIYSNLL